MQEVKKIVIMGPESTGKSTLCKDLAAHYNSFWCPEYAREYLLKNGTAYEYDDLLEIAKGQLRLEEEMLEKVSGIRYQVLMDEKGQKLKVGNKNSDPTSSLIADTSSLIRQTSNLKPQTLNPKLLFIDTNMYVMKVWCEFVFEKCHQFILDEIVAREYDLYLLMDIDLPWTKDELREYPDFESREKLYHIYKDILLNQHVSWVSISGSNKERLHHAITAVDKYVATG